MTLRNKVPFGNFKPGDTLWIPDGAIYDPLYWEPAPDEAAEVRHEEETELEAELAELQAEDKESD